MYDRALTTSELDTDDGLSVRFNLRAKALFLLLLVVYATLVVIYAFSGTSIYFTIINCLMLMAAGGLLFITNDVIVYFLASHPAWMFSFSAYFYSAVNLKPVEKDLYNAAQSITIAFVYQIACLVAFFLSFAILRARSPRQRPMGRRTMLALQRYSEALIVFGAITVALDATMANQTVTAVMANLQIFLWIGLGLHLHKNRGFKLDAVGILIVSLFAVLAIYANNRTFMMSAFLIVGIGYLYYSRRLFNLRSVLLGYFVINFLLLFSAVSLDIRISGGRESGKSMFQLYAEKLLSSESLVAVVIPFATHSSTANLHYFADETYGHDFWLPYFGSNNSLGDRFVVLPLMDVVCGQFAEADRIRWDDLRNLVLASLPELGQTKNLLYNDQLTWDLGLRDQDVVGKPMLTNACELYTMAGWTGVFLVTTIEFFVIFLYTALLRKQLEFYVLYLATVAILIVELTVSTSSLGVAASVIRGLPLAVLAIWLVKQISVLSFRPRGKSMLTRPLYGTDPNGR